MTSLPPLRVAVVGAGVAGLSAAWLLSRRHQVVLYETESRLGGHANTVEAGLECGVEPVDTGFIVYNEDNYPNFTRLLAHLDVASQPADMSLSVSLDGGSFEYSSLARGLFAQKRNLLRPGYWRMLADVLRFYREAPQDLAALETSPTSLGDYLDARGYCPAFRHDHLLPMAAAIWSTPLEEITEFPAAALIRFFINHGMMSLTGRGLWRTVSGGSRNYVRVLESQFSGEIVRGCRVTGVRREADGVGVRDASGWRSFDQVVLAVHADQALGLIEDPGSDERRVLGAFGYSRNHAVLHTDPRLMPRRRAAWAAWNHIGRRQEPAAGFVTYWMSHLQSLRSQDVFVSLNPSLPVSPDKVLRSEVYEHPIFNKAALAAQRELWGLQGRSGIWFCGSYFGYGFHEDALQAGLAVAEALGGVRRPWSVPNESGRISITSALRREEAA